MRVFYNEEFESQPIKNYYVKIDNVNVPEDLKGYKNIQARNTEDLIEKIKVKYRLKNRSDLIIQLWSQQNCSGVKFELNEDIPNDIEFLSVKVISNKADNI